MGYTTDWWEREGARITEERRAKYSSDPAYREAAKARAKGYREAKRIQREEFLGNPFMEVKGQIVPAMTVEGLCKFAWIDKARLKYMQKTGYIPPALTARPVRLYTYAQAELIKGLDLFLRNNAHHLRTPQTEKGADAVTALATQTAILASNWEN